MFQYWQVENPKEKAKLCKTSTTKEIKEGEVRLKVQYSSINYKDALALMGRPGVIRKFPLTPGIDIAGIVSESRHKDFKEGDAVFTNGFGLGEDKNGGLATEQILIGDDLMHKPQALSLKQVMQVGTAGTTAAYCLNDLLNVGIKPSDGSLYVTGATGGVGMFATALSAAAGFDVVAISRKKDDAMLKKIGASKVLNLEEFGIEERPLGKENIAAAIDCVGGDILVSLLARTKSNGAVAACGLAKDAQLNMTVFPFILRGVRLLGVSAVYQPKHKRQAAWELISKLDFTLFEGYFSDIALSQACEAAENILAGKHKGRYIVHMNEKS
ncbi:MAG: acryloyl-CoA reductase [Alphaproteobacteria bacterium]